MELLGAECCAMADWLFLSPSMAFHRQKFSVCGYTADQVECKYTYRQTDNNRDQTLRINALQKAYNCVYIEMAYGVVIVFLSRAVYCQDGELSTELFFDGFQSCPQRLIVRDEEIG